MKMDLYLYYMIHYVSYLVFDYVFEYFLFLMLLDDLPVKIDKTKKIDNLMMKTIPNYGNILFTHKIIYICRSVRNDFTLIVFSFL